MPKVSARNSCFTVFMLRKRKEAIKDTTVEARDISEAAQVSERPKTSIKSLPSASKSRQNCKILKSSLAVVTILLKIPLQATISSSEKAIIQQKLLLDYNTSCA